jgi:pimeloyl-ACP methyl ester carboxylesterase
MKNYFAWILILLIIQFKVKANECENFINSLPVEVEHKFLTVPLDWNNYSKSSKKVKVFYYIKRSSQKNAPYIIFFHGGPGGRSWAMFKRWIANNNHKKFNAIFFDQRGNGCSDTYPNEVPSSQFEINSLINYAANSIVRDAEAIKADLNITTSWMIFGQSYGSLLVHRYVQNYPKSISHAFAHGFALTHKMDNYRYLYRKHFINKTQEFSRHYPTLFRELNFIYDKQVRLLGCNMMYCPFKILPDNFFELVIDKNQWTVVSELLKNIIKTAQQNTVVRKVEAIPPLEIPFDAKMAAIEVISRVDYIRDNSQRYDVKDPFHCNESMKKLQYEFIRNDDFRFILSDSFFQCEPRFLNAEGFRNKIKHLFYPYFSLKSFSLSLNQSNIKFYLYAGDKDLYSPPTYYAEEIKNLGKRINFKKLIGGHGDYFEDPQIWQDLIFNL